MLLADPCFQLRSISYLLGQPEPPAPGTALPAPDRKHFSLQSCKWAREDRDLGLGQVSRLKSKFPGWKYSRGTGFCGHIWPDTSSHPTPATDTDYISVEELAQVEQMLAHLTSASAQVAAASLVSGATAAQYMSAQLCVSRTTTCLGV